VTTSQVGAEADAPVVDEQAGPLSQRIRRGWILELLVAKVWRVSTPVFGPIAFTLGTALSVVVTLVPAGLVILLAVFTSCHGL